MPCHLHVPCISYPALFFSMVLITEPLHTNLSWILFCPSIFTVYFHTHSVPWEAHRCELPHRHSGPWPSRFQLDSTVVGTGRNCTMGGGQVWRFSSYLSSCLSVFWSACFFSHSYSYNREVASHCYRSL